MSHLTYAEAIVVGLFQGVTELSPDDERLLQQLLHDTHEE